MMKNKEIEQKYLKMIEELNKKYEYMDEECYHADFDELIKKFIKDLGYEKIANEYEKAEANFWYA